MGEGARCLLVGGYQCVSMLRAETLDMFAICIVRIVIAAIIGSAIVSRDSIGIKIRI